MAFEALLAKARAADDVRADFDELEAVGPPPYSDGRGYQVQRRWSNLFEGADAFIASMLGFALSAPGYTMRDVNDWFDGQGLSAGRLVPESKALPADTLTGRFTLPVFVIQGVRGLHDADEPGQDLRRQARRAAEGIRDHHRGPLRGVHAPDGVSEGDGCAARPRDVAATKRCHASAADGMSGRSLLSAGRPGERRDMTDRESPFTRAFLFYFAVSSSQRRLLSMIVGRIEVE